MTNPQLLRLQDQLGHLKLLTAQARLEALLQDASAQEVTYADFLDRLLTEEVTAKGEKAVSIVKSSRSWPPGASWTTARISCSSGRRARGKPIWPLGWG